MTLLCQTHTGLKAASIIVAWQGYRFLLVFMKIWDIGVVLSARSPGFLSNSSSVRALMLLKPNFGLSPIKLWSLLKDCHFSRISKRYKDPAKAYSNQSPVTKHNESPKFVPPPANNGINFNANIESKRRFWKLYHKIEPFFVVQPNSVKCNLSRRFVGIH